MKNVEAGVNTNVASALGHSLTTSIIPNTPAYKSLKTLVEEQEKLVRAIRDIVCQEAEPIVYEKVVYSTLISE